MKKDVNPILAALVIVACIGIVGWVWKEKTDLPPRPSLVPAGAGGKAIKELRHEAKVAQREGRPVPAEATGAACKPLVLPKVEGSVWSAGEKDAPIQVVAVMPLVKD